MWSIFSRDPTKDFAYDVGSQVSGFEERSIWTLHEGKHKQTGEPVSVFVFDLKGNSESQVQLAKASFKRIKTLRHPNILTFVDGLETEKVLYIVTEQVTPLELYIKNNEHHSKQNELAISWGLHQITKGLSFLVNDCNLIHNNVCMPSVFVDKAGEWKLAGVDYMYPASGPESIPPVKILSSLEKYDPPEKAERGRRPSAKWSADMWGLGCLIWEVFNGSLPRTGALKSLGKIPKNLVPNYCELVGANPKSRPNPAKFIDSCKSSGGFMDNQFVRTMLFLDEIQIKDQVEKIEFFNSLSPVLDTFPEAFCKHKILPQLVNAFEFGNAGSSILAPLFKLGKLLDSDDYQKKIVPCVVKLFSSTDRATRVKLLQQMEMFAEHLQTTTVNDKIFPNVVQGFMDTNPVVREHTIKAMLYLAPKLNHKNLNEELLKHFARLQTKDDQGGIRTNTTVCLGKIACYLNPQSRQKIISSAFLRAMKDPFPPARQAGILAMAASHHYFTLQESASRLLPALCAMAVDPEKTVRDQAFKAIKCFLGKLEKVSEHPELAAEIEKDVLSGGSIAASSSTWTGWAVSGMSSLTSKLYKGNRGATPPKQSVQPQDPSSTNQETAKPAAVVGATETAQKRKEPEVEEETRPGRDGWDDNWDNEDEWGDMNDVSETKAGKDEPSAGDGWEDDPDDWGSLEEPATNTNQSAATGAMSLQMGKDFVPADSSAKTASSYNWGDDVNSDDFFSTLISDTKKPGLKSTSRSRPQAASASSQLSGKSQSYSGSKASSSGGGWEDSGWDDDSGGWDETAGDDWGSGFKPTGESKAEEMRRKREERKAQQQKRLEEKRAAKGGGALKLGAKKVAAD